MGGSFPAFVSTQLEDTISAIMKRALISRLKTHPLKTVSFFVQLLPASRGQYLGNEASDSREVQSVTQGESNRVNSSFPNRSWTYNVLCISADLSFLNGG